MNIPQNTNGQKTMANSSPVVLSSDQSTLPVSAASLPLPTGASTSALQSTGNTSVASIDTKTPALGQALAASSVPVVLTAAQLTTLTPLSSVSVSNFPATQPVSIASMPSTPVTGTFWQATQPVSAASLPLPAGAAQDSTLTGGTAKTINRGGAKGSTTAADITSTASGANHQPMDVVIYDASGNLKDPTQIRALTSADQVTVANASIPVTGTFWQATQPISGTVTANAGTGTMAVSAASLPLPSGAATAAKQPALGTAGLPASDIITVQGTTLMTPLAISATTLPLPTGAAADATLTGGTQQTKITDGTNVATVKAASTAAVAADKAVVVAVSPNNTVPVSIASMPSTPVTGTFWQATQPVSLATNTPTLQAGSTTAVTQATGTNLHTVVDSGTITTVSAVTAITNALPAGTNLMGKVGIDQTTPGTTNAVTQVPATTGGLSTFHLVSAATTNATVVKASAGQLYGWTIYNSNAAMRKVVLHNASTTPTAGAAVFYAINVPPGAMANVHFNNGIAFSTGIAITTVTGLADSDATAVALNDLTINLSYK